MIATCNLRAFREKLVSSTSVVLCVVHTVYYMHDFKTQKNISQKPSVLFMVPP